MAAPLLLLAAGCLFPSSPPPDPRPALGQVTLALDDLLARAHAGDPAAAEAWSAAHARFEEAIEPALRAKLDPVEVARTEYAFGQVRRRLADGRDPEDAVDALVRRLDDQVTGPRSVAQR